MKLVRHLNNIGLAILWGVTMILVPSQPINAQDTPPPFDSNTLYMPGEIVVGFSSMQSGEALLSQALALADEMNAQVVDLFANVVLLRFAENANVPALVNQIGGMRGVSYAEPNYIRWIPEYLADPTAEFKDRWVNIPHSRNKVTFRVMNAKGEQNGFLTFSLKELRSMKSIRDGQAVPTWPNDPFLWTWGWDWSNASEIWTDKAPNPQVCVVDTGVDDKHPDLMGRVLAGKDFVNDDGKPDDDNGHGTHVAGTIAAIMNNKKGFAGISTAKIVPVKVLSAQGWGTSFDIAQGIVYCANLANVKIINLSLGGYDADLTEYNALNYAINTKGKLVVAAAGNTSRYSFTFPAAWAVEWVCKDGTDNYPTDCSGSNDNVLAPGLISVGASQLPWGEQQHDVNGDGLLWVDTNGDGQEPLNTDANYWEEHFWPDMCAADFSQYGAWVEMVAPGEEILSAQPVSYNFWNHYFWGADSDGDGYEWYSGTSMSTPHVAGSAARVWGTFPSKTNIQIASQLQTAPGWNKMTPAMDPNMLNPAVGYHDTGYKGEAPYCWPNATYGGRYDMSGARFVDVAAAMNRFAIWYAVSDAITGLPLSNATVSAYVGTSNTLADKTIIAKTNRWAPLLNLKVGKSYNIKVNKPGYTAGEVDVDPHRWTCEPGGRCSLFLAIPPMGRIGVVANWGWLGEDLDLYTWLPNVSSPGGVVGAGASGHPNDLGAGELSDFPRARWNRDGGWGDPLNVETLTIVPRPGSPTIPYYNKTANDYYDFLLTNYGIYGSADLNQELLTLRVWVDGKVVGYVVKTDVCDTDGADNIPGTADDEIWWYAGRMKLGTFIPVNACGTTAIWPYAGVGSIQGVPEGPGGK